MTLKINLISGPRNISTALMYSFAQRSDTTVVDEPFYAYYLVKTGADHPGREETIRSMDTDAEKIANTLLGYGNAPLLFIKSMAHHYVGIPDEFLFGVSNIFLIRDPQLLIASFAKVIKHPTMQDIGLKREWELFQRLWEEEGHPPTVLDSREVLKDPEAVLSRLCQLLNIPFEKAMLSWPAGPTKEDGIWAKYWYKSVHSSTGFRTEPGSVNALPAHCQSLYEEALPYYQQLVQYSIKASDVTTI